MRLILLENRSKGAAQPKASKTTQVPPRPCTSASIVVETTVRYLVVRHDAQGNTNSSIRVSSLHRAIYGTIGLLPDRSRRHFCPKRP
jgi:hypothetical protein